MLFVVSIIFKFFITPCLIQFIFAPESNVIGNSVLFILPLMKSEFDFSLLAIDCKLSLMQFASVEGICCALALTFNLCVSFFVLRLENSPIHFLKI